MSLNNVSDKLYYTAEDRSVTIPLLSDHSHPINSNEPPPTFPSIFPKLRWYWYVVLILLIAFVALCYTIWEKPIINDFLGLTLCQITEVGSLPLISIIFTYLHIYAALWMTFYPLKFIGCCQIPGTNVGLGWQGIVPSKSKKMASMATQLMSSKLFKVQEMFAKVDAHEIARRLHTPMNQVIRSTVENAAKDISPVAWNSLNGEVREDILSLVTSQTQSIVYDFFSKIQEKIEDCFDVETLVLDAVTKDQDLLNQMFIRCGNKELSYIRNSAAWMGGIFGIIQAIIYIYYDAHWVLPTAGLIVGCFTNWIALLVIFSPVQPISLFGGKLILQGLFIKRQRAVAEEYGRTVAKELLTSRAILNALLNGPKSPELCRTILDSVDDACEKTMNLSPVLRKFADYTMGPEQFILIKGAIADAVLLSMPNALQHVEDYMNDCLDTETELREKLAALPPDEFEQLLHPIFQEDEWKLILMGGVLGVVIGLLQTYLINTGHCIHTG